MEYLWAFLWGGVICALIQILMEKTKLMPGRIMVILVCLGAVMSAVGIYSTLEKYAGAGMNVLLLGFGNNLYKGVRDAIDMEGFLGIFLGGFKAGAAGLCASLVFGYIASWIVNPKMKK